jgi:hypothetical protein
VTDRHRDCPGSQKRGTVHGQQDPAATRPTSEQRYRHDGTDDHDNELDRSEYHRFGRSTLAEKQI